MNPSRYFSIMCLPGFPLLSLFNQSS
uniref:Uncharacterized protein n=1 Tax=Rhizophora mucronata TaxID=61149 RepID=A0A2P2N9M8_RHIMU